MRRVRQALPALLLVCAVLVLCAGRVLSAHEIGTTRVNALFAADGTYHVDLITDAASLLEKVEAIADVEPSADGPDAATLERRLLALTTVLESRIHVTFDATDVHPTLVIVVAAAADATSVPSAHITLTGTVPAGATHFTWRFGWTFASYALSTRTPLDREAVNTLLEGDQSSRPISLTTPVPSANWSDTVRRYLARGFTSVLPLGPDHILFVLGLFLLHSRPRALLVQIAAFTIAHSIALGLGMYDLVTLPSRIVEPAIACSIAYVAIENLLQSDVKRWRIGVVFACGLLHGLGFASVLRAVGLPRTEFLTALVSFNVGIDVAQVAVIGGAMLLLGGWCAERGWYRARVVIPASAAIACTAVFWAVERMVG